ncbi:protein GUCD1-like isoform X2 [Dreissena polymorpha]|uniref:protein GUCD1-like isoform X2 n=1 Tax=Dreissena polymorpha TaxID=45954 RepID=UPI002264BB6A|nr:protein GUCD1-like isoform X2 [Dreissena polymorpha]
MEAKDQSVHIYTAEERSQVINAVPLYMQTYDWDCGLACASMVLKYLGKGTKTVYTSDLENLKCGESIWTIDLARLMKFYNINHLLCTVTLGVDKGYQKQTFYNEDGRFSNDEVRISKLFEEAADIGICVQKRICSKWSVGIDEIISSVRAGHVAIVLVDWSHLECIWCDRRHCKSCCFPCISSSCCRSYQGHFVVVCGIDEKKRRIFFKNPSYDEDMCCSLMEKFDAARKSYGTDEDILFVYKDGVS